MTLCTTHIPNYPYTHKTRMPACKKVMEERGGRRGWGWGNGITGFPPPSSPIPLASSHSAGWMGRGEEGRAVDFRPSCFALKGSIAVGPRTHAPIILCPYTAGVQYTVYGEDVTFGDTCDVMM